MPTKARPSALLAGRRAIQSRIELPRIATGIAASLTFLCLVSLTPAQGPKETKPDKNAAGQAKDLAGRSAPACVRNIKEIDGTWLDRATLSSPAKAAPAGNLTLGNPCKVRHGGKSVDLTIGAGRRLLLDGTLKKQ